MHKHICIFVGSSLYLWMMYLYHWPSLLTTSHEFVPIPARVRDKLTYTSSAQVLSSLAFGVLSPRTRTSAAMKMAPPRVALNADNKYEVKLNWPYKFSNRTLGPKF